MKILQLIVFFCFSLSSLHSAAVANIPADIHLPALDIHSLHQEDVFSEKLGNAPRFAVERAVDIDPKNQNSWIKENGIWKWRLRVKADQAVSLNFSFTEFKMSANSKLAIYSADLKQKMREFSSADNNIHNELWTPVIMSDDVIIELSAPTEEIDKLQARLTQINQGYRTFSQPTEKSGACNVDVVCSEGDDWREEIDSVGVISTGGSTFCTGFMVNNTSNDRSPYFMTAKHCRINASSAPSLVVYWNYQASQCGGGRDGDLNQFNTGSEFLAGSSKSDFTLVKLLKKPDPSWNVSYAGFDARDLDAAQAVAIHHPSTDEKSISFEYDPVTVTSYLGTDIPGNGSHIRVEDWDVGTTEPGSSGSPLFNNERRVIGQLHGGYASCSSQTADWYGRLNTSWEGEGAPETRLKDWLDPDKTGVLFTDTIR
ncbi:MAG: serine protease [Bacteriovoracaceae bacterium]